MSVINHPSLKAELLYLIGRSTTPLSGAELYERSELADEIVKVAKALGNLRDDGKIVRAPGEGRARYTLATGVAAPAPAGKAGRSKAVQVDDNARSTGGLMPKQAITTLQRLTGLPPMTERGRGDPSAVRPEPVEGMPGADAESRTQLAPGLDGGPQWWIDQHGVLEIASPDSVDTITLNRAEAQRMAEMVLAMRGVLERRA